jgi:hypothetical protein
VRQVILALGDDGHGDAEPVVNAVCAAKLYMRRKALHYGISGLVDDGWTALPTAQEFGELVKALADWAKAHEVYGAAPALHSFWAADSAPVVITSGLYPATAPISPWEWSALATAADDALNRIREAALKADEGASRPPAPTKAYCLRGNREVRWEGRVRLPPKLYQLLGLLLDSHPRPVSFGRMAECLYDRAEPPDDKTIQNRVSELENRLIEIRFPLHWKADTTDRLIVPV